MELSLFKILKKKYESTVKQLLKLCAANHESSSKVKETQKKRAKFETREKKVMLPKEDEEEEDFTDKMNKLT